MLIMHIGIDCCAADLLRDLKNRVWTNWLSSSLSSLTRFNAFTAMLCAIPFTHDVV